MPTPNVDLAKVHAVETGMPVHVADETGAIKHIVFPTGQVFTREDPAPAVVETPVEAPKEPTVVSEPVVVTPPAPVEEKPVEAVVEPVKVPPVVEQPKPEAVEDPLPTPVVEKQQPVVEAPKPVEPVQPVEGKVLVSLPVGSSTPVVAPAPVKAAGVDWVKIFLVVSVLGLGAFEAAKQFHLL